LSHLFGLVCESRSGFGTSGLRPHSLPQGFVASRKCANEPPSLLGVAGLQVLSDKLLAAVSFLKS
jgi:hypothetical protein